MKHLKSIIACLLFVAITFNSLAQETILENTTLWKIEHPNLEKPSYIFGTMHMLCPDDFLISEKLRNVMKSIEALVLEVDMSDPAEMKVMQASMANPKKISEELSQEQYAKLDALVQKVMQMPLANLDAYGLSMLNMVLITKMLPCTQLKSYEVELTQIAKEKGLPVNQLESVSSQLSAIKAAYPTDFAFQQMLLFEAYKNDFILAAEAYVKEDITTAVSLITKTSYMNDNATKFMQVNRNKDWVEKMPQMMQEKSNLFAVGAAHLTSSYGVIQLLRDKGYTVSPVFN